MIYVMNNISFPVRRGVRVVPSLILVYMSLNYEPQELRYTYVTTQFDKLRTLNFFFKVR